MTKPAKKKRVRTLVNKWVTPRCSKEMVRLAALSGLHQHEIVEALIFAFGSEAIEIAREARKSAEHARVATLEGGS